MYAEFHGMIDGTICACIKSAYWDCSAPPPPPVPPPVRPDDNRAARRNTTAHPW